MRARAVLVEEFVAMASIDGLGTKMHSIGALLLELGPDVPAVLFEGDAASKAYLTGIGVPALLLDGNAAQCVHLSSHQTGGVLLLCLEDASRGSTCRTRTTALAAGGRSRSRRADGASGAGSVRAPRADLPRVRLLVRGGRLRRVGALGADVDHPEGRQGREDGVE